MHILALVVGVCVHLGGDAMLFVVSCVIGGRLSGYVGGEYFEYSSRRAAAFELLPIPVGMSLAGLILARWGIAGL